MLLPKARKIHKTNPTRNKRRAAFPFRTTAWMGAAATASHPLSRGLSVWVLPSYRGNISPARTSYGAVGSVHIGSTIIKSSTNDVSEVRTRSSNLNGLRARGTPLQLQSFLSA